MFDDQGAEGWEIALVFNHETDYYIAVFKRPKTETSSNVTDDMPHRCQVIMETPLAEDNLKYHSTAIPGQSYHYLLIDDRVIQIDYCPWCGEKI